MLHCGARVVAVEPNPKLARLLKSWYPTIEVLQVAMSARGGAASLRLSRLHPTVATLSQRWIDRMSQQSAFAQVKWDADLQVETLTLDGLIEQCGQPSFCKIDVEGSEPAVLQGLTEPIGTISFEFLPEALDLAVNCVDRLIQLGSYEFNLTRGETARLQFAGWRSAAEIIDAANASQQPGEIYARLAD